MPVCDVCYVAYNEEYIYINNIICVVWEYQDTSVWTKQGSYAIYLFIVQLEGLGVTPSRMHNRMPVSQNWHKWDQAAARTVIETWRARYQIFWGII